MDETTLASAKPSRVAKSDIVPRAHRSMGGRDQRIRQAFTRGDPKDITFARLCLRQGLVKYDQVKSRLEILLTGEQLKCGLHRLGNASRGSRTPGAEAINEV